MSLILWQWCYLSPTTCQFMRVLNWSICGIGNRSSRFFHERKSSLVRHRSKNWQYKSLRIWCVNPRSYLQTLLNAFKLTPTSGDPFQGFVGIAYLEVTCQPLLLVALGDCVDCRRVQRLAVFPGGTVKDLPLSSWLLSQVHQPKWVPQLVTDLSWGKSASLRHCRKLKILRLKFYPLRSLFKGARVLVFFCQFQ